MPVRLFPFSAEKTKYEEEEEEEEMREEEREKENRKSKGMKKKRKDEDDDDEEQEEEQGMTQSRMRQSLIWLGDGDKATPERQSAVVSRPLHETCLKHLRKETGVLAHLVGLCTEHFLIRLSLKLVAMQAGSPMELIVHAL